MRRVLFSLGWLLCLPVLAPAQTARVTAPQLEFRAAPDGVLLATLAEGTGLALGERRPPWRQVTLEGWIWAPSVRSNQRNGHDLSVSNSDGENLRRTPNGRILARLREGMLLDELGRQNRWVRVRRVGWVREDGLDLPDAPAAQRAAGGSAADNDSAWVRTGEAGGVLLSTRAGDTVAHVRPLTTMEVLAREGNWARVRLEGWAWIPSFAAPADSGAVLTDVTPATLASNPDGFRGRLLEWTVQFIALDHAEAIRTDFYEGEPFILARGPGEEPGFVYIAVPPRLVEQVERLSPLQDITVLARVRTARSELMDAPVLDLLDITSR